MRQLEGHIRQLESISGCQIFRVEEKNSTYEVRRDATHPLLEEEKESITGALLPRLPEIKKQGKGIPFVCGSKIGLSFGGVRVEESYFYVVFYNEKREKAAFFSLLCLLAGKVRNETVWENEIVILNRTESKEEVKLLQLEEEKPKYSYAREESLLRAIVKGDSEELKKLLSGGGFLFLGNTSKNELTHQRNLCISILALATRAAIHGDVPTNIAYQKYEELLKKLDSIYGKEEIYLFMVGALQSFVELVNEEKNSRIKNNYVEQTKLYVAKHYKDKIVIKDIADYLGLNASYLSHVFHREMGITINEYIQKEKINVAKNLLINTEIDLLTIAHYLSFSSQSYFGSVFRAITGMTPQKFRNQHKLRELL